MLENFDPSKVTELIERYIGRRMGRLLIQATILALLLGGIGLGLKWFFGELVKDLIWPFLVWTFGGVDAGISLDNLEPIIIVLTATLAFVVGLMALMVFVAVRFLRRRVVSQHAIDELALARDKAITFSTTQLGTVPILRNGMGREESGQMELVTPSRNFLLLLNGYRFSGLVS